MTKIDILIQKTMEIVELNKFVVRNAISSLCNE
jgi:hypothetical protein